MKRLAILGAGGHGRVIADAAKLCGWKEVIFYDDAWPQVKVNGYWEVIGDSQTFLSSHRDVDGVIVAVGDNNYREQKSNELRALGTELVTVIHPSAIVSQHSKLGQGCFIAAGAVVHIDAHICDYSIINTSAVIEHDCSIGKAVHISPGAVLAGGVVVGSRSWVGANACIRQLIKIGNDVVIGAGSVVVKDILTVQTVVGNPAATLNR